jgi:hypothetical protein
VPPVVMEAHARPSGPGRASPGTLSSMSSRAWAGPKTRAFGRATGSRAFWTSIPARAAVQARRTSCARALGGSGDAGPALGSTCAHATKASAPRPRLGLSYARRPVLMHATASG